MTSPTTPTTPTTLTTPTTKMIRILVADDHAIVRAGLREFIADQPDMVVACEASTGTETVALIRSGVELDVVLLDISMPERNGLDALKTLRRLRPDLPVLILSSYAEEDFAPNLLRAGAAGYLPKNAAAADLVHAIRTVVAGQRYVSAELAQMLALELTRPRKEAPLHELLSAREFQIFYKLAVGVRLQDIARELNLSVGSVNTYRSRLMGKIGLRSNTELTRYAMKNRLLN
jgi:two-component system invasion response regulator UvrY